MSAGKSYATLSLLGALASIGLFAWLDFLTGTEVRSVLFYLLPIVLVAWTQRYTIVLLISLVSSLVWTAVAFYTTDFALPSIALWNEATTLVIFVLVGVAISGVRRERDRLEDAHGRIRELLDRESRMARTDPLTGLPNSREFTDRLRTEISRAARADAPLGVMYVDLDNFKLVNDRHGHAAGDALLRSIADAVTRSLRESDTAARLGGDEFAVLLWQPDRDGSAMVGERVLKAVHEAAGEYADCEVGASIGIAWFARLPATPEEVVRLADEAMYRAKNAGKNKVVIVEPKPETDPAD